MKRHNYKVIIFAALILSMNYGCKRFVDLDPKTALSSESYFKTQSDFTNAVNGLYSGLRDYYSRFYQLAEIPSDNTQANNYTLSLAPLDQLTWTSSDTYITTNWKSSYAIIARANIILDKIDPINMREDFKAQYKGEAKFIRALMYFNLVQFFGHVPLVLHEIKTEKDAYSYPQVSTQDVYGQIEKDLEDAIKALPASYPSNEIGKATKGAALSLLGKVLVTNKQFTEAIPVLKEVINAHIYSLLPNYADVFSVENEHNKEIIFAIQYIGDGHGEGSNFSIAFAPHGSGEEITSGGSPASVNEGTIDLYNAFEDGDLRKAVSIAKYSKGGGDVTYYTRKYLDKPIGPNEGNNNWIVLRYADVLLLYAEALNESSSANTDLALDYLNKVRHRAGLSFLSNIDQAALRKAIDHERRVELCFEGDRWLDLIRTGNMVNTMEAYKTKYSNGGGFQVDVYEVTPNKILFPIPFDEINLNSNLIQNPGY